MNRLGRCDWPGPSVPVLAYKVRFEDDPVPNLIECNPLIDARGRVYITGRSKLARIDGSDGRIIYQRDLAYYPGEQLSLKDGRLFFAGGNFFYCFDANTGNTIWTVYSPRGPQYGQVVDDRGVVYNSSGYSVLARRTSDGSIIWEHSGQPDFVFGAPSLNESKDTVFVPPGDRIQARRTSDGSLNWANNIGRQAFGASPVENGKIYVGSADWNLYCFDVVTGQEIWRFYGERSDRNGVALASDGTIYFCTDSGGDDHIYAISPNGTELWRCYFPYGWSPHQAPTVAGDGTIYVTLTEAVQQLGKCLSISAAGQILWTVDFPQKTVASPTIAPDGTMYVACSDKYLYAFRDWQNAIPADYQLLKGSLTSGNLTDVEQSDDRYMVLSSKPAGPVIGRSDTIEANFQSTLLDPHLASMEIVLESGSPAPNITQTVKLRRKASSAYDTVSVTNVTFLDHSLHISIPNPERYVQEFTNKVYLKLIYNPSGLGCGNTFQVRLDQIQTKVKFRLP